MSHVDIALDGPAVLIRIRVGQLELLQRAAKVAVATNKLGTAHFTRDEQEALEHLALCMQATRDDPSDYINGQHVVHGFAL